MSYIIETIRCECDFCGREVECQYLHGIWSCVDQDGCADACDQQERQDDWPFVD